MKNKIFLSLNIFLLCIFFISCQREKNTAPTPENKIVIGDLIEDYIFKSQAEKDGSVMLSFSDAAWLKNEEEDINISGSFFLNKNPITTTLNKILIIENVVIPYNGDNSFPGYFLQSFGNSQTKKNWLKSLWGKKISISFSSSSVSQRTLDSSGNFYVPQPIQMQSVFADSFIVSKNSTNTIHWNADPQNPSQKVFICIVYEGDLAHESDPNLPTGTPVQLFLEAPDNGSYTLTTAQLDMLPIGGRTTIAVARGNYEWFEDPITGETVLVSALTTSGSGPIGVK